MMKYGNNGMLGKPGTKKVVEKYVKFCLNISNISHRARRGPGEIYQDCLEGCHGKRRSTRKAMEIKLRAILYNAALPLSRNLTELKQG